MGNAVSSIHLCNVKITPTNQLDFSNHAEQVAYFKSKELFVSEVNKYQARSGKIRVKGYVEDFNNVNYGYYTNMYNGKAKIYYFWILQKNFLSRNTTELTIQLDVFQTWLFDVQFGQCLIERAHVSDDTIGANTVPEDFELGDYVTINKTTVDSLTGDLCYLIAVTDVGGGNIGTKYGKLYSGYCLRYYHSNDYSMLTNYITELANDGKADCIGFIFTFPDSVLKNKMPNLASGDFIGILENMLSEYISISNVKKSFSYKERSYIPYNNKMLIYPYNFLTVTNSSGGNVVLKLENFNNYDSIMFRMDSVLAQNPKFTLTPLHYSNNSFAIEDSIETQGFGLCSWNNDNYANWYANNQNSINAQSQNAVASFRANYETAGNSYANANANADISRNMGYLNAGMQAVGSISSMLSGNVGGGLLSGLSAAGSAATTDMARTISANNANTDLANTNLMNTTNYQNTIRLIMASVKDASVQPNTCKGDTSACGLDVTRGTNTFYIKQTAIKPEYAKKIDLYFQMYGYQLNEVGYPQAYMKNRAKWNYIKTLNARVVSPIPMEDKSAIEQMLDNGLTIWHSEDNMFYYDTKNSIV